VVALLLSTLNPQLSTSFAQGSLTPPGAPAPTMKSLDQIEARTPISSAPFTVNRPGSYYLTTNLAVTSGDAIIINTNQVTLDLNGFTVSSTASPAGGYGVKMNVPGGNSDIAIVNGHIKGGVTNNGTTFGGPGFGNGIDVPGGVVQNVRISGVTVSGCGANGIYLGTGDSTVVESCTAENIGFSGITASSVLHSTAFQCGINGILADTVSDCSGQAIGSGTGIEAFRTASNCNGSSVTGMGINAVTANNCFGDASGSGTGLSVASGVAIGCCGSSVLGVGIHAKIANSCVVGGGTTNITYKYNMP
jgi:hypothetical protein